MDVNVHEGRNEHYFHKVLMYKVFSLPIICRISIEKCTDQDAYKSSTTFVYSDHTEEGIETTKPLHCAVMPTIYHYNKTYATE